MGYMDGTAVLTVAALTITAFHDLFFQNNDRSQTLKYPVCLPIIFSIIVAHGSAFLLTNTVLIIAAVLYDVEVGNFLITGIKWAVLASVMIEPIVYQKIASRGPNTFLNTLCNKVVNIALATALQDFILAATIFCAGTMTLLCFDAPPLDATPPGPRPLSLRPRLDTSKVPICVLIVGLLQAFALFALYKDRANTTLTITSDHIVTWGPLIATPFVMPSVELKWESLLFSTILCTPFVFFTPPFVFDKGQRLVVVYSRLAQFGTAGVLGGIWRLVAAEPGFSHF